MDHVFHRTVPGLECALIIFCYYFNSEIITATVIVIFEFYHTVKAVSDTVIAFYMHYLIES